MDGFRTSLFAKLNGDATLTALLATTSSIYHRRAPLNAGFSLILYSKQSGMPTWSFAGNPFVSQTWVIQGIDRGSLGGIVEDIDKRINVILTDPVMTLSDGTLLYMRRELDVDYEEGDDPDILIHHVGGLYRTIIDRA